MATSDRFIDGEGELGGCRDSSFAGFAKGMLDLFELCNGFRRARFSGDHKKEPSLSFFLGCVPNKNDPPTIGVQEGGTPNGQSAASVRRLSGEG